jgi:HlyD family secretion protein
LEETIVDTRAWQAIRHPFRAGAICFAAGLSLATGAHAQVTATGSLEPLQTVIIGSYVSGIVESVTCDVNAVVAKGQVCAKIDPRRFQRAVEQAKAAVENAQAQLAVHQAAYAQALAAYERNKALYEKGVVSKSVYEAMTSAYEQAKAQIDLDKANIDLRRAELGSAELNLSYTDIIAPIEGIVLTRKIETGETVAATLQSPTLFVMASDLKKLRLTANVKEADVVSIKKGDTAACSAKALPKRTFNARVAQVRNDPETVNGEVFYKVVLEVDNQDLLLKPGMSASVRISPGKD